MKIGICGPFNPYSLKNELNYNGELPNINKGATAVNTYVRELLRQGHEVIVITSAIPGGNSDIVIESTNIKIHIVRSNPSIFFSHVFSRIYMISRLEKTISKYIDEIDVLHAQWTYDFAYAAKKFTNVVPVFCTVRDWCPYIITMHHGLKKIQWYLYSLINNSVMKNNSVHFIANSHYTYNQVIKSYPEKKYIQYLIQ